MRKCSFLSLILLFLFLIIFVHTGLVQAEPTTGDGLLDDWERNGLGQNGDGTIDVDLPAMGADLFHKDIFMETDYMVDVSVGVENQAVGEHSSQVGNGKVIKAGLITNQTINVFGVSREYHLFVPDEHIDAPVVFLFHGHNNDYNGLIGLDENGTALPANTFPYRNWLTIAAREQIILAIPNGYDTGELKGWNDCRGDAVGNSEADDVLFVETLIDFLSDTYRVDSRRIYATGVSNGGHMSIRLAQELPRKIAAIAAISASNPVNSECVASTEPISALFINGTTDPLLPYEGGQIAEDRGQTFSVENTVDYWVQRNQLDSTPIITSVPDSFPDDNCTVTKYEYNNGTSGAEVILYKVLNGGHASPSIKQRYNYPYVPVVLGNQNGDIEMAAEVWSFFEDKVGGEKIWLPFLKKN